MKPLLASLRSVNLLLLLLTLWLLVCERRACGIRREIITWRLLRRVEERTSKTSGRRFGGLAKIQTKLARFVFAFAAFAAPSLRLRLLYITFTSGESYFSLFISLLFYTQFLHTHTVVTFENSLASQPASHINHLCVCVCVYLSSPPFCWTVNSLSRVQ